MRAVIQAIGLCLIVVGVYYLLDLLCHIVSVVRTPSDLKPSVDAVAELIDANGIVIPDEREGVAIGKAVSLGLLVPFYMIWVWGLAKLVGVGAQLVSGVSAERREFWAAMRTLLVVTRNARATASGPSTEISLEQKSGP